MTADSTFSEDKYRLLVEQASDGIAVYDRTGTILEVNTRACEMIGYSHDELVGMSVSQIVARDDLTETPLRYEALATGQPLLGERTLVRRDGTSMPVELSARMLSNGQIQVIVRDITERKRMEVEITRSRDFYLTLLEDFPALIWRSGLDARVNYVNRTWLKFRGRSLEEELAEGWLDGLHPDDVERTAELYLRCFAAREPFVMEYRLRHHNGEYCWVRDHGTPFNDLDGNFAGYLGVCHDVSDEKMAAEEVLRLNSELEQRVAERTAQLQAANYDLQAQIVERMRAEAQISFQAQVLEQVQTAVIVTDMDGVVTYWNTQAERLYGWRADEVMGHPIVDLTVIPEHVETAKEILASVASTGRWEGEYVSRRKDGTPIAVYVLESVIYNADGEPAGIAGASVDITERKRAEEEHANLLRQVEYQRTRLDSIVHSVPGLVWEAWGRPDDEGQSIGYVNDYVEQMLGYTVEEWLATPNFWLTIVHPEDKEQAARVAQEHFVSGQSGTNTFRWIAKDGRVLWVESRHTIIFDEEGNPAGMRGVTMDITESKLVEEERTALLSSEQGARRMAEEAVHTRDELLAIVSHDLKNPLAAIKGNSQLLRRRMAQVMPQDGQKLLAVLERIDEAATRMSLLLNDLIDFGRLQVGQSLTLQRRAVDLVALVKGIAAEYQGTVENSEIKVVTDLESLQGWWDATRLEQVMANLVSNATKYSPNGGTITVRLWREADDDGRLWAMLSMTDQGLGIAPEDLPHIFEWFRRARSTSGRISGAGIGLASASYIVDQHGGKISVASALGKGSTFTVRLPL
jgi:two-component system, cell cycle sensor histidine kinase and response regulator CckA